MRRRAQSALGVDPDLGDHLRSLAERMDEVDAAVRRGDDRNAAEIRDVLADLSERLAAIEARVTALETDRG